MRVFLLYAGYGMHYCISARAASWRRWLAILLQQQE